jgi:glutamyl-tRNA reductase
MNILLTGLSHRTAPVSLREQLAFSPEGVATALLLFRRQFPQTEAAILSTCNRVEVLVATESASPNPAAVVSFLAQARDLPVGAFQPYLYQLQNEQAVRHILRVTGGLDSMVIGDYQVVSQVKQAYAQASEQGSTGRVLNRLFHHALAASKRMRSETEIGRLKVSIPSIALDVARQVFDDFARKRTLILGSGDTAQAVCEYLRQANARDFVVMSRGSGNARMLAAAFEARYADFDQLDEELAGADIVLAATRCPKPLVTVDRVRRAQAHRRGRLLFLLDLAVPRNIEPGVQALPQVVMYDIDALGKVAQDNQKHRAAQLQSCESILDEEVTGFQQWLSEARSAPLIAQMYADARALRDAEMARLLDQCPDLTPAQRAAIAQMLDRMTAKFLHPCAATLRQHQGAGALTALTDMFHSVTRRLQGP